VQAGEVVVGLDGSLGRVGPPVGRDSPGGDREAAAAAAVRDVPIRLARAGYLARRPGRRPWQHAWWVPSDADCAFAPLFKVRAVLDPARQVDVPAVVLTGLAMACGLGPRLLPYGPAGARHHLDAAVGQLPADLRELIAQVQAAVDSAVLSQRL
jgi:hypothetical protein